MSTIIFDIETGPLPDDQLQAMIPVFDPSTVKVGNFGVEKAKEKISTAKAEYYFEAMKRAALSPLTGQVLAIGYKRDAKVAIDDSTERQMLLRFWEKFCKQEKAGGRMVGHNIFGFDLPFMVRRSWTLGLAHKVPSTLIKQDRYWSPVFVDTMVRWRLGDYRKYVSLETLAKAFSVGGKPDGVSGADFARLWEEDRPRAVAYLKNDLEITFQVAMRLGIV